MGRRQAREQAGPIARGVDCRRDMRHGAWTASAGERNTPALKMTATCAKHSLGVLRRGEGGRKLGVIRVTRVVQARFAAGRILKTPQEREQSDHRRCGVWGHRKGRCTRKRSYDHKYGRIMNANKLISCPGEPPTFHDIKRSFRRNERDEIVNPIRPQGAGRNRNRRRPPRGIRQRDHHATGNGARPADSRSINCWVNWMSHEFQPSTEPLCQERNSRLPIPDNGGRR